MTITTPSPDSGVCAGSEWVSRQVWGSLTANDLSQRLSERQSETELLPSPSDPFSRSNTSSKLKLTEPCLRVNRTDVVMCSESSSHRHSHNVLHMSREAKSNEDDDDEREKGRVGVKEEGGYRPDKIKKGVEEPGALTLARRVESRIFRGACWLPEVAVCPAAGERRPPHHRRSATSPYTPSTAACTPPARCPLPQHRYFTCA